MGTSNTKTNNTAQKANEPETRTKFPHAWPESIDVDGEGNIYFTDAYEGTLYRISRTEDGKLKAAEELLIEGLKRASGISINRNENVLYMGLALKSGKGTEYKIARIPLEIFTICDRITVLRDEICGFLYFFLHSSKPFISSNTSSMFVRELNRLK